MCKTNDILKRLYDRAGDVLALTRKLLDDADSCACVEKTEKQNPMFAACPEFKKGPYIAEFYPSGEEKDRVLAEAQKVENSRRQAVARKWLNDAQDAILEASTAESNGSSADYYDLPEGATRLQDLISFRNMNAQDGEIFRAIYRKGHCPHSSPLRDAKKILFYAQEEVARLENA